MKRNRVVASTLALGLLLSLMIGSGWAQEGGRPVAPQGDVSIEANVSSAITYQGMLLEDGSPVNGFRDMTFGFFDNDACAGLPAIITVVPDVEVQEGVFSAHVSVSHGYFDGKGLWLKVDVEGTPLGCQEILPVPYALSLRPGAEVIGEVTNLEVLFARNTATTGPSYGLYGLTDSNAGIGVMGSAAAAGGTTYGVYGFSNSAEGAGVFAQGQEGGADLILGGNADTVHGDDGRITSDPRYPSSDLNFVTNDGIRVDLDENGDGEDADFGIRDKDDNLIFQVDESGDVIHGGPGVAAFPRPSYDSGWVAIAQNTCEELTHNLGGNVDNYVVDLQFRVGTSIHVVGFGGVSDRAADNYDEGGWWSGLTTTSIEVCRNYSDSLLDSFRLRIWMYP